MLLKVFGFIKEKRIVVSKISEIHVQNFRTPIEPSDANDQYDFTPHYYCVRTKIEMQKISRL